eukprot:9294543-Karenia_brevis.AAC.1
MAYAHMDTCYAMNLMAQVRHILQIRRHTEAQGKLWTYPVFILPRCPYTWNFGAPSVCTLNWIQW